MKLSDLILIAGILIVIVGANIDSWDILMRVIGYNIILVAYLSERNPK